MMPVLPFYGDLVATFQVPIGERVASDMRRGGEGVYLEVRDRNAGGDETWVMRAPIVSLALRTSFAVPLHWKRTRSKKTQRTRATGSKQPGWRNVHRWIRMKTERGASLEGPGLQTGPQVRP
jgi:hypothetical protein